MRSATANAGFIWRARVVLLAADGWRMRRSRDGFRIRVRLRSIGENGTSSSGVPCCSTKSYRVGLAPSTKSNLGDAGTSAGEVRCHALGVEIAHRSLEGRVRHRRSGVASTRRSAVAQWAVKFTTDLELVAKMTHIVGNFLDHRRTQSSCAWMSGPRFTRSTAPSLPIPIGIPERPTRTMFASVQ